jgi:transposase
VKTATEADMVHGMRKYSDEQILKVAELLVAGGRKNSDIANIVGVNPCLVSDMKNKGAHKRFMERATK